MLPACMYELLAKVQQSTQHGEALQSTTKHTALRSSELALRCLTELSRRVRQVIAGHGTARRCAAEL